MKTPTMVIRLLLGLIFTVFGLNRFLHFIPMQLIGGLLLLTGITVLLGLVILAPIVVNILFFHSFLAPSGLAIAFFVVAMEVFLAWRYQDAFAPLFTSSAAIQHRGGPAGFLKVIDDKTLGFADFAGNRQYITLGNLTENPKAFIFLIDYTNRQRVKLWSEARVVEDDRELLKRLKPNSYRAQVEQAILFTVSAWDSNCPQHIPQRFEAANVKAMLAERDQRIEALTNELNRLQGKR